MSDILNQIKFSRDSVEIPIDSLLKKHKGDETPKQRKTLVSPELEIAILHSANLDMEIILKEKVGSIATLQNTISELKQMLINTQKDRDDEARKFAEELQSLSLPSFDSSAPTSSSHTEESEIDKTLSAYQEENTRLREYLRCEQREKEMAISSYRKEIDELKTHYRDYDIEKSSLETRITSIQQELTECRKQMEESSLKEVQRTELLTSMEGIIEKDKSDRAESHNLIITLEQEISSVKKQYNECSACLKSLRDHCTCLESESSDPLTAATIDSTDAVEMRSALNSCQVTLNEVKEELKAVIDQLTSSRLALSSKENELSISMDQNHVLKEQLESQTTAVLTLRQQVDDVVRQCEVEKKAAIRSAEDVTEIQEKIRVTESELSVMHVNSDHYLDDIQAVKSVSSTLRQQLTENEEIRRSLETRLTAAEIMAHTAEMERSRQEALVQALHVRVAALQEQLNAKSSETECATDEETLARLQAMVSQLEKEKTDVAATLNAKENALVEKEKALAECVQTISELRGKEQELARRILQNERLDKEINSLHIKIQKAEAKQGEEKMKYENRVLFAEQSLEAFKKEMEQNLREKMVLEAEAKSYQEMTATMKAKHEELCNEIEKANKTIHDYEEMIARLQTLEATKDEALLQHLTEASTLRADLARATASRELASQTLSEESSRMQSQLEAIAEENNRLRGTVEAKSSAEETSMSLLRESEMKLDSWRIGLENSYRQKKVLKQAARQVLEEDAAVKEKLVKERRQRRALERNIMSREDLESAKKRQVEEEGNSAEFASFDWARKLSRFIARNPASWGEYEEEIPALPEEAAIPVIQNTIENLEWRENEKNYLLNWIDFFAHGGVIENENRFARALHIQGVTFDILDGFLTLMIPFLKTGIRSEYAVQTFIKQKPSVICDLEVVICPSNKKTNGESVERDDTVVVMHQI